LELDIIQILFSQAIYHIAVSFVSASTCKSDKEYVTCWVPYGSFLGPAPFLIYISDHPDCYAMQRLSFTHDTALNMLRPNVIDLQNTINE